MNESLGKDVRALFDQIQELTEKHPDATVVMAVRCDEQSDVAYSTYGDERGFQLTMWELTGELHRRIDMEGRAGEDIPGFE